jgi:hypothetical protein
MGGKSTTIDPGSVGSFQVNQATYGIVTPVILGTSRQQANIIDHFNFTTLKHTQKSGKGGGSTTTVSYTYKAAVMLAMCEGPIAGIGSVWVDTDTVTTLAATGLTLFDGSIGQEPWPYILSTESSLPWIYKLFGSTIDPLTDKISHYLPYSGLAYVAGYIDLNSNAGVKIYNFEIKGQLLDTGDGVDINPADGCRYILTALDFTDSNIHAETYENYQLFCKAADLYVTVPLTDQTAAYETINKLCEMTNTITFWSQRKIKFIPRCETEITGNGVTYTPNTTPEYDLSDDDFLEDEDGKLVTWERTGNAETYNQVTVEFTNRANGYETETVDYQILADINKRGLRPMSTVTYHEIHTRDRAGYAAQMLAMDGCYGRNTYKFKLGIKHCLLEPGDIVTLTNAANGLNKLPVAIESKKEVELGEYEFEAKYKPIGTYVPARYTSYDPVRPATDRNIDPGDANAPMFYETPFTDNYNIGIATSGGENWGGAYVWISSDDESYEQVGEIAGPSKYGKIISAMSDTDTSITVEMADSDAQLLSVSSTAADANATLLAVDQEWMAYETATLVSPRVYTLSGLRRGLHGSVVAEHVVNADFLRYDAEGFLYPYSAEDVGREIFIKLVSYNVFGLGAQGLEDVAAYPYTITGAGYVSSSYIFTQASAVTVWSIEHNLNKYPVVACVDASGNTIEGAISYTSVNTLTITFSVALAGTAYLT